MNAGVRYIVQNVDAAIEFYRDHLGFALEAHPAPGFAMLTGADLTLLLNEPGAGGAGAAMPDGAVPEPGGWSRFQLPVEDLDATVERLTTAGVNFRGPVVTGKGGRQALALDPSGNLVELFERA